MGASQSIYAYRHATRHPLGERELNRKGEVSPRDKGEVCPSQESNAAHALLRLAVAHCEHDVASRCRTMIIISS